MDAPEAPKDAPCMRLFLSVDLFGSTRLKNVLNQQQLWSRYRAATGVLLALRRKNVVHGAAEIVDEAILTSLEVDTVDFDWAAVIESFYKDFHQEFVTQVDKVRGEMQLATGPSNFEVEPWKAVGDELIYVFEVQSRRQLHWLVIAFLAALRTNDGSLLEHDGKPERHGLRLKGSAWVAGFPVRNRLVTLPGKGGANHDFLGPEVDAGFRIGKCTRPGMLVVSMEVAEFLAEIPTTMRPMTGMIVGWEKLKGVWEDRHYPVIWVDFPVGHLPELESEEFDDWELQESPLSCAWGTAGDKKRNLPELHAHLQKIRERLPPRLGIVDPYIVRDPDRTDVVPEPHSEIQLLLKHVTKFRADALRQDAPADETTTATPLPTEAQISRIIDRAVSPDLSRDPASQTVTDPPQSLTPEN